jgi:filamentous hemagglutinin
LGANHAFGGDTAIEIGGGIKVPAKGGSASTGVLLPAFSLPFTDGDKGNK